MGMDVWLVVRWWGTLFLVGAAAFPLTKLLFGQNKYCQFPNDRLQKSSFCGWWDEGYLFSKAVGMAVVTWVVYALGIIRIFPFTTTSILIALALLFFGGIALHIKYQISNSKKKPWVLRSGFWVFLVEELVFFAALLFWSWIKAHEPSIRGLEKFMDFGFTQSILNAQYFPPADMWYAGAPINYYYFGHIVMAVLTKLSGLDLRYTFNLMLATLFALTATMSFSIGRQLLIANSQLLIGKTRQQLSMNNQLLTIFGGLLTAFLVTLAGNLQTIYAFTKGYTGENVVPFWQLLWKIGEIGGIGGIGEKLSEGMGRYWYANATRFIPYTIHEFPSYSFVVSDVHGHVLSLPFVLLAIGIVVTLALSGKQESVMNAYFTLHASRFTLVFYGFLVGVLLMTNAIDGPIYLALAVLVLGISNFQFPMPNGKKAKEVGLSVVFIVVMALLTSLPFLTHFKSFVSGLAVNCPPAFLANMQLGPFIFEGVEKCQRSPIWMMALLWGFFISCGVWLFVNHIKYQRSNIKYNTPNQLLLVFFFFSLALILFSEFFYFKDIYPLHFRSNTMFKLGYQAFILFSIVSAYVIVRVLTGFTRGQRDIKNQIVNIKYTYKKSKRLRTIFLIFLLPQLFLVSIYPIFSVRSYFNGLRNYEGLDGLAWLRKQYPDDYAGIQYMNNELRIMNDGKEQSLALVEADGDSYTDYARFSAFTGIPTIIGWPVHEWLWRGSYEVVAPRREEVRRIYESSQLHETRELLIGYGVKYVIVGTLEREKYQQLQEWKFGELGQPVFRQGQTVIYTILSKIVN